jgi:hypothetical protein
MYMCILFTPFLEAEDAAWESSARFSRSSFSVVAPAIYRILDGQPSQNPLY